MTSNLRTCSTALLFLLSSVSFAQAPDSGPPYRVGENVTRPEKVAGDPPEYTIHARKARVQGVVIIEALIDEEGDVTGAEILKGLPMGLGESALEAVKTWKFKPATMDGQPVPVYYTLTVNFKLGEDKPKLLQAQELFWAFERKHPELQAHIGHGRPEEALAYVQGLPDSSEVHFVRAFLLMGLRRSPEARKEVERVNEGPERDLLKHLLVLSALMEFGAEQIDAELQAAAEALEADPESREAMLRKSRLLRQKAEFMHYGPERQALLDEADQLEKRAAPPN